MLTPNRSASVSSEEASNRSDTGVSGTAGSHAVTPGAYRSDSLPEEFLSCRRIGRRNAVTYAKSEMVDLPDRFEDLAIETDEPGSEGQSPSTSGTSKQQH